MIETTEKSVVRNPEKDVMFHSGAAPSRILKKIASAAADEAFEGLARGVRESDLVGIEVLVTVRLQPIGTTKPETPAAP